MRRLTFSTPRSRPCDRAGVDVNVVRRVQSETTPRYSSAKQYTIETSMLSRRPLKSVASLRR